MVGGTPGARRGRRAVRIRAAWLLAVLAASVSGVAGAFPAERAWEHLEAQCAFGPRNPGSPGHAACRAYIVGVLRASGGRIHEQTFMHTIPGTHEPVALTNILARYGPLRSGGLLIGAHWDTRPWAERDPNPQQRDEPILGANDGASGVAILLTLAEMFAVEAPSFPVLLVCFDGEDLGREEHPEEYCAGSRHFARYLSEPFPEAGLVLDMVASETMLLSVEDISREQVAEFARLIDELAADLKLPAYDPFGAPSLIDDHIPLIQAGLPTVLLVDFRDPHWHTHADVPANCSAASLAQTGRLVERILSGGYFR